jgi:phospholipase/lecithinase/hemolysin
MKGMRVYRHLASVAIFGLLYLVSSIPASATAFSGIYAFGDSLSDTGNIYLASGGTTPVSPPYSNGRFTNDNVWVQDLSASLGLGAVTPSLAGGNDYAFGGAQTGTTLAHTQNSTDLLSQLTAFTSTVHSPQPDALYTLWIGANDLNALFGGLATGAIAPTSIGTDLAQAIGNVGSFVSGLANAGMQNLLVLNVPDLSKTPDAQALANSTANPAATLATIQQVTQQYNAALAATLASLSSTDGFALTQVDTFQLLDQVGQDPAKYHLTNVTDPCWTGNLTDPTSGTVCAQPDQYLFWDGEHPTAAGHQILANHVRSAMVPEPGSIAMLMTGLLMLMLLARSARRQQKPKV